MDSISQLIFSRTNLLRIATTLGLYADQRASGKLTDDELVERMRKNIEIEVAQSSDRVPTSFNIYFSSPSPDIAQQVTTELTTTLISGNIEINQNDIDRQNKFLDREMADVRAKLTDQEEKVRLYKDRHIGELPGQLSGNIQILSGKQSQLQNEQDALSQAKQRQAYLESVLNQYNSAPVAKPGESPGWLACPRAGTAASESAVGGPEFALHRSASRRPQAERADCYDPADERPVCRATEKQAAGFP